jgi:hypothetical protein
MAVPTAVQEEQPPSSPVSVKDTRYSYAAVFPGLFDPEDEATMIVPNVTNFSSNKISSQPELNIQEHRYENIKSGTVPLSSFQVRADKDMLYLRLTLYSVRLNSSRK